MYNLLEYTEYFYRRISYVVKISAGMSSTWAFVCAAVYIIVTGPTCYLPSDFEFRITVARPRWHFPLYILYYDWSLEPNRQETINNIICDSM